MFWMCEIKQTPCVTSSYSIKINFTVIYLKCKFIYNELCFLKFSSIV